MLFSPAPKGPRDPIYGIRSEGDDHVGRFDKPVSVYEASHVWREMAKERAQSLRRVD